jgi:hypothetical protein
MSTTAPDPQIQVTPPTRHPVYGQEVRPQKIFRAVHEAAGPEADAVRPEKVAVLVCHGMGQQVPFEHIDLVADAITRGPGRDRVRGKVNVNFATLGEQRLPRAEIRLATGEQGREREVHVYEAYWAPLTEGKVSALDVTRFLFDAGFRGIEYSLRGYFDRWMMGRWRPFRLGVGTLVSLVCALTVVCSGLLLYGTLGFVVVVGLASSLLGASVIADGLTDLAAWWLHDLLRSPLGLTLFIFPIVVLVWANRVVGWVFGSRKAYEAALASSLPRPDGVGAPAQPAPSTLPRAVKPLSVAVAGLVAAWTVASAGMMLFHFQRVVFDRAWGTPPAAPALWYSLLFLASATVGCLLLRGFYIQFLGDVAVYLSSHRLNEFDALRADIRKVGMEAGCAIYGALDEDGGLPVYDGVVVVGHSLGSVVAYDTLNAVLNRDVALGGKLKAEERTLGLITFGSPLDKSAFIFRTQKERSEVREALSAAVQPLVESPSARSNIPWVNIHSPLDPISGTVDYYDPPENTRAPGELPDHRNVVNLADPEAGAYGMAHTRYWTNPLLAEQLYAAVTAPVNTRR